MKDFNKYSYYFDEEVKIAAYCPFCEADLNPVKAKIVDNSADMNLIHIQCNKCFGYIIALVLKTEQGLSSIGLITDLNYTDVYRFIDKPAISADEVINIHQNFNQKNFIKNLINK